MYNARMYKDDAWSPMSQKEKLTFVGFSIAFVGFLVWLIK